ncbi:hypothetical protein, partial [Vibrio cincinnatiensis]|uniref:hypothetical protein n=1 Tax=Vibrio cincinnatiensis TaxID=675 RepID=UPI001EDFDDA4
TSTQQFARDVSSSFAGGYAENTARQCMGLGGKRSFENVAIDAFGNALGNSVAGKYQAAAEQARAMQIKSFNGVGPIFDWRTASRNIGEPTTQVSPLAIADDISNWDWKEEDLIFSKREAVLANHFENLNTGQSIGSNWAWSGQCTVDNPYGLSQAQVEQIAWDYVGGRKNLPPEGSSTDVSTNQQLSELLNYTGNVSSISGTAISAVEAATPGFSIYSQTKGVSSGTAWTSHVASVGQSPSAYLSTLGAYDPNAKNVIFSASKNDISKASTRLGYGFALVGAGASALQYSEAVYYDKQKFGYVRTSTNVFHAWKFVGDALAFGAGYIPYVGVAVNVGWTAFNVSGEVNKVQEGMRWLDNEK